MRIENFPIMWDTIAIDSDVSNSGSRDNISQEWYSEYWTENNGLTIFEKTFGCDVNIW